MKLSRRLVLSYLLVGVIPLGGISAALWYVARSGLNDVTATGEKALEQVAYQKLQAMRNIKLAQLNRYFTERRGELDVLQDTVQTLGEMAFSQLQKTQARQKKRLQSYLRDLKTDLQSMQKDSALPPLLHALGRAAEEGDGRLHDAAARHAPVLKRLLRSSRSGGLLLIHPDGRILYGVNQSLKAEQTIPPLKTTPLGPLLQTARTDPTPQIHISDLTEGLLRKEPSFFLLFAVLDNKKKRAGYCALQYRAEAIQQRLYACAGTDAPSHTHLFGRDLKHRCSSHPGLATERQGTRTNLPVIKSALAGKSGKGIVKNEAQQHVFVCWDFVDMGPDLRWAMITEMNIEEAVCGAHTRSLYEAYLHTYGYYDLFLIAPEGYCFHTIVHEADYQTNLIHGPYKDSGLGKAARGIHNQKDFAFSDFQPHGPSKNIPAAFMAAPVRLGSESPLIVALQLSDKSITAMMEQGTDVKQRLDAYLVGQDWHLRSNTILRPEEYSIQSTHAEKKEIKTQAVESALAGKTDVGVIKDYRGRNALAAWAPVKVFGERWALICEIDTRVAFAGAKQMDRYGDRTMASIGSVSLFLFAVMAVLSLLVGALMARDIVTPTEMVVRFARRITSGETPPPLALESPLEELQVMAAGLNGAIDSMRRSLEATHRSEENLRVTLHSIGDAVISTDREKRVLLMNPVAEELTGWSMADAVGKPLAQIFTILNADTRNPADDIVDKVLTTDKVVGLANHTLLIARDGREYQIADSAAPIRNGAEVVGIIIVFRDVTEEYAMQNQLRQSQKMEAIGQLTSGLAHNLGNVLAGIMGAADLMRMKGPAAHDEYLQMIVDSTDYGTGLIQQLMSLARKQPLNLLPTDIVTTLKNAVFLLKGTFGSETEVIADIPETPVMVVGDPSQLQSSFLNLFINAVHAMPKGGRITVSLRTIELLPQRNNTDAPTLPAGLHAEIKIKDTGKGIPEESRERIFEPFFTTKDPDKGTGLGLAAVYGTVQQHKGSISFTTEVGAGTCFRILLPVCTDKEALEEPVPERFMRGTGTILLVDDDASILPTVSHILEALGYDVLPAKDGETGLRIFEEKHSEIDLVILDMVMPGISGRECFEAMQKIDPVVKVILASGLVPPEELGLLTETGVQGFIQKPFHSSELSVLVQKALG